MADPTRAQMLAEAYRRGLMPPQQKAAYEEAARRGVVDDAYAKGQATTDPVTGFLTTAARNVPFLTEAGDALNAGVQTAYKAATGQPANFGDEWSRLRGQEQGTVDQFRQAHPIASNAAAAAGMAASSLPFVAAPAREVAGAVSGGARSVARRLISQTPRNALTGAAIGATYAAAQPGTLDQRAQGADNALGPSALAGVVAPVALEGAGAVAGGVRNLASRVPAAASTVADAATGSGAFAPAPPQSVTGLNPVETSGLDKFIRVAKPDVNAMIGQTAAYNAAGIDPALVDTSGRRGQGIIRALASRATPAQDSVEQFAAQRRVGLASRMSDQARDIVSSDPRTPEAITKDVVDARTAQANKDFGAVRPQMVDVTPSMANALTSPRGLRAIREARDNTVDPTERDALTLLYNHVNPGESGEAAGDLTGAKISVGQAQDISKALFDRADASNIDQERGALVQFGKAIRDGASIQSPDYEAALARFANASGLSEAPAIGKSALNPGTDNFVANLDRLRAIPDETAPGAPAGNALDPQAQTQGIVLARPGFRRAIELASGGGRPGTAMGVAETLADAPEQQARNAALLGDDDATHLQDNMRLERQAVMNASAASPGAGSNTFLNSMAGGAVNGEVSPGDAIQTMGSIASLGHGNPLPAAGQALTAYLKNTRAFSDDEAEALANLAIDPSKHDDALNFIAGRIGAPAAQGLAPMMQDAAAGATSAGDASTSPILAAIAASNALQPQGQPPTAGP